MTQSWYALRVKPHKERAVERLLLARDIEVYLPAITVSPKNPRAAKVRPFFPGYMFVCSDLEEVGHNAFAWTPGTRGLVTFGDIPAMVPEYLITRLKQQVREIVKNGGIRQDYTKEEPVRIIDGPFSGYEAIFDIYLPGEARVQVLLSFLSHYPQPLRLDSTAISKMK